MMHKTLGKLTATGLALAMLAACNGQDGGTQSAGSTAPAASADAGASAGTGTTAGTGTGTGTGATAGTGTSTSGGTSSGGSGVGGTGIPALVNVNLQNVLNDLSVRLQVDRANIPVNAQIPVNVAANVCGVSVSVLSVSTGGQASCTAKTASAELAQVVQQQIAAGGSVGGGAQGGSTATTGGASGSAGSSTSGSTGTSANSSGTSETTNRTTTPQ